MIDWLINLDHSITLGEVMLFLSAKTVWIPLYAAIAILFFVPRWYGEKSQALISGSRIPLWLTGLIGVLAVLLCFGLTEQVTNIVKNIIERPRPGNEPLLQGLLLSLPEGAGGGYGFFSAHALRIIQPDLSGQTLYHRCSVRSRCRHTHRPGRILSV